MLPSLPSRARLRGGPLAAAVLGFLVFLWFFDPRLLDPTRIDWTSSNDLATHFLGAHFFRHEAWAWPPGMLHTYAQGVNASVGLTDSIPLPALLLKPFDALLPPAVNYLGVWVALCFVLQGWVACRLLEALGLPPGRAVLGALLLCAMPFMVARATLHIALASHFLLLWAILVYVEALRLPRRFAAWCALLPIAAIVNPYLLATVSPVFAASTLAQLWKGPREARKRTLVLAGAAAALTGFTLYLAGFFTASVANTWGSYGELQWNLLGWFNSQNVGNLLPGFNVAEIGQTDAYVYLGAGGILVLLAAVWLVYKRGGRIPVEYLPLLIAAIAIGMLAASHRVAAGPVFLVQIPLPQELLEKLNPFRSSGRMAWLPTYLLMATAIVVCARLKRLPYVLLLLGAFALNLADERTIRATAKSMVDRGPHKGHPDCSALPKEIDRVMFVPRVALEDYGIADVFPIAVCAAERGLPINVGYLARVDLPSFDRTLREAAAQLDAPLAPRVAYAYANPAVGALLGAPADTPRMGRYSLFVPKDAQRGPRTLASPPEWAWPLMVDMGVNGLGRHVELKGFAQPMIGWVWSYAQDPTVIVPVPAGVDGDVRVQIYARPMPPGAGDMRVIPKVNGAPLPELVLEEARGLVWSAIVVPREVVARSPGAMRVELLLPPSPPLKQRGQYPGDKARLWVSMMGFAAIDPAATRLRFASSSPDVMMLGEGWSGAEPWGVWTQADAAKVRVPLPEHGGGALRLRFNGHAYASKGETQRVRVKVNGRPAAEWELVSLAPDEWREVDIDPALVPQDAKDLDVAFEIGRPASPGHGDPRRLGLAMVSLELLRR